MLECASRKDDLSFDDDTRSCIVNWSYIAAANFLVAAGLFLFHRKRVAAMLCSFERDLEVCATVPL